MSLSQLQKELGLPSPDGKTPVWGMILMGIFILALTGLFTLQSASLTQSQDLLIYYESAANIIVKGQVPFRDYLLEYPPFALAAILFPNLVTLGWPLSYYAYIILFGLENIIIFGVIMVVVAALLQKNSPEKPILPVLMNLTLTGIFFSFLLLWRYDLFPTMLALLAFQSWLNRRSFLSGVWVGLGAASKIFPGALLLVFGLEALFRRNYSSIFKLVVGVALSFGITVIPFLFIGWDGIQEMLKFHAERGLEIGSLPAAVLGSLGTLGISPAKPVFNHKAWHFDGYSNIIIFLFVLMAVLYIFLAFRISQVSRKSVDGLTFNELARFSFAAITIFIVTNKVLSPQYLIWIMPFAFLTFKKPVLFLSGIILTTLVYAFPNVGIMQSPVMFALINIRNVILVIMLIQSMRIENIRVA
jgi:uncharacterized membrane protein